jgi:ribA/ribD-fused uncharacterized protein
MPIQFLAGDLFANNIGAQVFAHGCNCQGSMGAGIAKEFRRRYPEMYEEYRARCIATPRRFNLGDAWLWKEEGKPWVFNLGTQEGYWRARASYGAIKTSLESMKQQAIEASIAGIAVPRIGTGYGGLSWKKVRAIVERVFNNWSGILYVYEEFVPANEGSQAAMKHVIQFYSVSDEYGEFSNFAAFPIKLRGKLWPTSEHYFQAQKFAGTEHAEGIRTTRSPMIAARMGRDRKKPLRRDWESVKDDIMREAVLAKFTQHPDLLKLLLATGDAHLVEHTPRDAYWGDGGDGSGKNRLGEILMQVRDQLRGESNAGSEDV